MNYLCLTRHATQQLFVASEVVNCPTRQVLEEILKAEDRHIDKIEELADQIEQNSPWDLSQPTCIENRCIGKRG